MSEEKILQIFVSQIILKFVYTTEQKWVPCQTFPL